MTDTQTDLEPPETADEIAEMSERLRRATRWTVIGVGISVLAVIVAGISLGVWAASIGAAGHRNSWDDARRAHETCTAGAATRADTISIEHGRFDRDANAIDSDEATVDLIEANVMSVAAIVGADNPLVTNAVENIATRRVRIDDDRAALAAARADFDEKRPPIDPNSCPPAPAGPRP